MRGPATTLTIDGEDAIAGTGVLTKDGIGTLVLADTNSYSGGTVLNAGTLLLSASGAAGTGGVTFSAGGQTLSIANAALPGNIFGNVIGAFGEGDTIDLTGIAFVDGLDMIYNPSTGALSLIGPGVSLTFRVEDPESIDFVVESDGSGGTKIVLGDGVTIEGTSGDDRIDAGHTALGEPLPTASADWIKGNGGDDRISGHGGNDWLVGGKGDDRIKGGDGDDRLEAGRRANKLRGGDGLDTFVFHDEFATTTGKAKFGHAEIADFIVGEDGIQLDDALFAAIGATLDGNEFHLGRRAQDADDRIIYHAKSGRLLYDADGAGGEDAMQFAKLDKKLDLSVGDFLVA